MQVPEDLIRKSWEKGLIEFKNEDKIFDLLILTPTPSRERNEIDYLWFK
jgi:hypothetical protein